VKKQNSVKYILRLALTLLAITAVVAAALAAVNAVTEPIIQAQTAKKTQAAIEAVLPGGGEKLEQFTDETGLVQAVYASETGYAVQVAPAGFDGEIVMMVGVSKSGTVLGIDVISHTETAGLGAVAGADSAKGEAFRQQFVGQSGELAVDKDGGQIDSLTSATITSRAVVKGVNAALACVAKLG
jgi:electron transport complex protein RnfG